MLCGTALPAVPGPSPPSAGLPSHEVAVAAFSAVATASAIPTSSLVASSATVRRPQIVAGGIAGVGAMAPLGAVPGWTVVRVLVQGAGRTGATGSAISAASVARSPVRHLSLLGCGGGLGRLAPLSFLAVGTAARRRDLFNQVQGHL
jgi:hypothetical protein